MKRTVLLVLGAAGLVLGVVLASGGGWLLAAYGSAGVVTVEAGRLETTGRARAVLTDLVAVNSQVPFSSSLGTVTLTVADPEGGAVFAGYAPPPAVDDYLTGRAYTVAAPAEGGGWQFTQVPGRGTPDDPAAETFWTQSAAGQPADLPLDGLSGPVTLVVMRPDAGPGVAADLTLVFRSETVFPLAVGLLIGGGVLGLLGVALVVWSRRVPATPPQPDTEPAAPPAPTDAAGVPIPVLTVMGADPTTAGPATPDAATSGAAAGAVVGAVVGEPSEEPAPTPDPAAGPPPGGSNVVVLPPPPGDPLHGPVSPGGLDHPEIADTPLFAMAASATTAPVLDVTPGTDGPPPSPTAPEATPDPAGADSPATTSDPAGADSPATTSDPAGADSPATTPDPAGADSPATTPDPAGADVPAAAATPADGPPAAPDRVAPDPTEPHEPEPHQPEAEQPEAAGPVPAATTPEPAVRESGQAASAVEAAAPEPAATAPEPADLPTPDATADVPPPGTPTDGPPVADRRP